MFPDPFDILSQCRGQVAQRPSERLAFAKEDIIEAPQPLRHLCLRNRRTLDRDQPFAQFGGALNLPGTALGPDRCGREDEDDRVGSEDQRAKPRLPVFGRGDVLTIQERPETRELEAGHEFLGQRGAVRPCIGDEDARLFGSGLHDRSAGAVFQLKVGHMGCSISGASPASVVRRISRTSLRSKRRARCIVWRSSHITRS